MHCSFEAVGVTDWYIQKNLRNFSYFRDCKKSFLSFPPPPSPLPRFCSKTMGATSSKKLTEGKVTSSYRWSVLINCTSIDPCGMRSAMRRTNIVRENHQIARYFYMVGLGLWDFLPASASTSVFLSVRSPCHGSSHRRLFLIWMAELFLSVIVDTILYFCFYNLNYRSLHFSDILSKWIKQHILVFGGEMWFIVWE